MSLSLLLFSITQIRVKSNLKVDEFVLGLSLTNGVKIGTIYVPILLNTFKERKVTLCDRSKT